MRFEERNLPYPKSFFWARTPRLCAVGAVVTSSSSAKQKSNHSEADFLPEYRHCSFFLTEIK